MATFYIKDIQVKKMTNLNHPYPDDSIIWIQHQTTGLINSCCYFSFETDKIKHEGCPSISLSLGELRAIKPEFKMFQLGIWVGNFSPLGHSPEGSARVSRISARIEYSQSKSTNWSALIRYTNPRKTVFYELRADYVRSEFIFLRGVPVEQEGIIWSDALSDMDDAIFSLEDTADALNMFKNLLENE